jgi:sugar/nucleoside kinase (ribokinase family)
MLRELDVVVLSEEDVGGDWEILDQYAAEARLLVVTRGPEGAILRRRGAPDASYPAYATDEVDPTGAGDVFAAAFLIRLRETDDPDQATRFANCVASFAVEGPGTTTLPTLEQVRRRGSCAE